MEQYTHTRIAAIRAVVSDDLYVVEAGVVAEAMILRHVARHLVPDALFRSEIRLPPPVRSFRRSSHARSFRPCGSVDRRRSLT